MKLTVIDRETRIGEAQEGVEQTLDCVNLREKGGALVALMPPKVLATLGGRPVACDSRDDSTGILTQDDDGTLRLACVVGREDAVDYPDLEICRLNEGVSEGARVGSYLVLRGESGRLYYLHDAPGGGYFWLGALPEAPRWRAEATGEVTLLGDIPSVSFRSVVTNTAQGLSDDDKKRLSTAVLSAFSERMESARDSGYRFMPVMVRAAWRLKEGGLLSMSEPMRVAGGGLLPGRERIMLIPTASDKGLTGTQGGTFRLQGWRLQFTLLSELPEGWQEVVDGVEVWVSREPDPLREGDSPAIAFYQGNNGLRVSFSFPAASDEALEAQLPDLPMRGEALLTGSGDYLIGNGAAPYDEGVTGGQTTASQPDESANRADRIMAYADVLYTARGRTLTTSPRGNPLTTLCTTPDVGGRVTGIWPQMCGGGAFTRQYIYLATPAGLIALMHDKDGIHTNCRTVAPMQIIDAFPTLSGLYAVGKGGEVLRVKDAKAERICRRVEGVRRVGYSESLGLLMLLGDTSSLVLAEDSGFRVSRREFTMTMLPGLYCRRLGWYERGNGVVELYDADRERGGVPSGLSYRGRLPAPEGRSRRPRVLYVAVSGSVVMAQIRIRAGRGRVMTDVIRAHVSGKVDAGVRVPVTLPRGVTDWEVTVSGSYSRLEGIGWED